MKVLIIGSGISGLACAIQCAENGNEVIMVSPFSSERSQSVMAAGGINGALNTLNENDDYTQHAFDTIKGGCYIENEDDIRNLCKNAPKIVKWLMKIGVNFNKTKNDEICLRAFGGQQKRRTAFAGSSTGKQIVTALIQKCREFEIKGVIERKMGLYFYSALIRDGKCYGCLAFNNVTGELVPIYADAVVMATGGQNKIFGKTTGSELCDGYATAKLFTQGVKLRNLEFIQYHPTTIETDHKLMLITEASRGEGGRLFYYDGDKKVYFMEDKYGKNGNLMPRDIVSKEIYLCPSQVYLDLTFLGEKVIFKRLMEVYDLCKTYINLDVTKKPIPITPSIHFFMGGIKVDNKHRTNIDRLYAIGECASKYNGANRLGGNSLLIAVYSGKVSANDIFENLKENSAESQKYFTEYIAEQKQFLSNLKKSKSKFPCVYILKELAEIMNKNLGIVRSREQLEKALNSLAFYEDAVDVLNFDVSLSLYENYRLKYMLILARAILLSALNREETRGAHIREDFPNASPNFRACSVAEYQNGEIIISYEKETKESIDK